MSHQRCGFPAAGHLPLLPRDLTSPHRRGRNAASAGMSGVFPEILARMASASKSLEREAEAGCHFKVPGAWGGGWLFNLRVSMPTHAAASRYRHERQMWLRRHRGRGAHCQSGVQTMSDMLQVLSCMPNIRCYHLLQDSVGYGTSPDTYSRTATHLNTTSSYLCWRRSSSWTKAY
jgi:hypothetical protein